MFNFNINVKVQKMIEALENSPKVRWLCWGVILAVIVYGIPEILIAMAGLVK